MARHRLIGRAVLRFGLGGASAACVENLPKSSTIVASITVGPESCVAMQGDTMTLTATARHAAHVPLPDAEPGGASSDLGVVSVTRAGLIGGVSPGTARVSATADGASAHSTVTVVPRMTGLRISPDGATPVPGGSFGFVADVVGPSGTIITRLTPSWRSSDSAVLRVDAGGAALQSLSVGRRHACGVSATGEAWSWGGNSRGALGVPLATEQSAVPVKVVTDQPLTSVLAGCLHTCALAPDGVAWCWGRGTELGHGVGITRPTPAPVYGDHRFLTLSLGWIHTCRIATDSLPSCWGYNNAGALGRTTETLAAIPLPVENAPPLVSITAGYYVTFGLTADGTAWCWGWNGGGQLGSRDTLSGPTPRLVAGGHHCTAVTPGYLHACGLATDGLLYGWGSDLHGVLGDGGDSGPQATPVPVAGQLPALPTSMRRQ